MNSQNLSLITITMKNQSIKKSIRTKLIKKNKIHSQLIQQSQNPLKTHQISNVDTQQSLNLQSNTLIQTPPTITQTQPIQKTQLSNQFNNLPPIQYFYFKSKRTILLYWLRETIFQMNLLRHTFTLAGKYLQKYFEYKNGCIVFDKHQINIIVGSCLFLAAKLQQKVPPKLDVITNMLNITSQQILKKQQQVIKLLKFKLRIKTYSYQIDQYMHNWDQYPFNNQEFIRKQNFIYYQRFRNIYHRIDNIYIEQGIIDTEKTIKKVFLEVLGNREEVVNFLKVDMNDKIQINQYNSKEFATLKLRFACLTFNQYLGYQTSE